MQQLADLLPSLVQILESWWPACCIWYRRSVFGRAAGERWDELPIVIKRHKGMLLGAQLAPFLFNSSFKTTEI